MTSETQDTEHLRLLSAFHYVVAALAALFACLPLFHLFIGVAMVSGWGEMPREDPTAVAVGWVFIAFATLFILCGWAFAVCLVFAGRYLARRRRYLFCLVMAGVSCMFMPFGTVLGVFTIIVLMRDSVRELFGDADARAGGGLGAA